MNECKGKCNKFAFFRYLIRMRKIINSDNNEFHSKGSGVSGLTQVFLFALLLSLFLVGCSTKEDGVAYRGYHNTLGHYNGYFNANELVKKSQTTLANGRKDDYDEVIPLYNYGTTSQKKELIPDLDKAIKKCGKVVKRHTIVAESKKDMKWPEYNKWMDDNYHVIGQSNLYKGDYYKAQETFNFISNKYSSAAVQLRAYIWSSRAYFLDGDFSKAKQLLQKADGYEDLPKDIARELYLVKAEFFLMQGDFGNAIDPLEKGLVLITKKADRIIPQFVLGQLYDRMERSGDAKVAFQKVIKLKPPYELEFQSKLQMLLTDTKISRNYEDAQKVLLVMLEDLKNESYKDVIYYALGTVTLELEKRKEAVDYFEMALKFNKNNKSKRLKIFVTLGDLYFAQKQYPEAQVNYDSAYHNLAATHGRYKEIKARALSLNELVGYLNTISEKDSLISLCEKPASEIEKALAAVHEQMQSDMAEKKRKDEEERMAALKGQEIIGTFWIYNQDLLERGKKIFDDAWSGRPLKDNWRNQSLLAMMIGEKDESIVEIAATDSVETEDPKYKVPTIDELRLKLPCGNNKAIGEMKSDLAEAYYLAGLVYKEKLEDMDNAMSSWERMISKCEEGGFHPLAYYQMFRGWLTKEKEDGYTKNPFCSSCSSVFWGNQIKSKYPNSDWALLVDNPNYMNAEQMRKEEEEKNYTKAYNQYATNYPYDAVTTCTKAIAERPKNHLVCQYRMLKAICLGKTEVAFGIRENCEAELKAIVAECPNTEIATQASEMLKQLTVGSAQKVTTTSSNYIQANESEHYVVAVINSKEINVNQAKVKVADFTKTYFSGFDYKVSNTMFNEEKTFILVKSFVNLKDANDYFTTFVGDNDLISELNLVKNDKFIISKQNYLELFRSKDFNGYLEFFTKNY
jgi:tetratricopeptide (TPR) repeat protein